jgi:hypothetical protein
MYTNENNRLIIIVSEDATECTFELDLADGTRDAGTGIYRSEHENYWYELSGKNCNYSFDDPFEDVHNIVLEIYDCANDKPGSKLPMTSGM